MRSLVVAVLLALAVLASMEARALDVVLDGAAAIGDVDADGRAEVALALTRSNAGGRDEVGVAIFTAAPDGWRDRAFLTLADGTAVERLRLEPGRLKAVLRGYYPSDPSGRPSRVVMRSWAFVGGSLHGANARAHVPPDWREAAARRLPATGHVARSELD